MNFRHKKFQNSGFVIVPDALDEKKVSKLFCKIDVLFKAPFISFEGETCYVRSNFFNRNEHLQNYFFRPFILLIKNCGTNNISLL